MIRQARKEDRAAMTALWQECFGDDRQTVDAFFDSPVYGDILPLVYCDKETVVSQLFLIEGEVRDGDKVYPSYYLYAACTSPAYRRKGIMGSLIEAAAQTAKANGKDFVFLKPGSPELYDYYSKHGFVRTRYSCLYTVKKGERKPEPVTGIPVFYSGACCALSACFSEASGGKYRCEHYDGCGYAQYEISGSEIAVSDIDITPGLTEFVDYLLDKNGCEIAAVTLPAPSETDGEPNGMVLSCSGREIPEGVFLNFTLD